MLKIFHDLTQNFDCDVSNSLVGPPGHINGDSPDGPLRSAPDSASNEIPESLAPIVSDAPDVSSNLESPKHLFIRENPW